MLPWAWGNTSWPRNACPSCFAVAQSDKDAAYCVEGTAIAIHLLILPQLCLSQILLPASQRQQAPIPAYFPIYVVLLTDWLFQVIIVGVGPAGLLLCLLLAKRGISVTMLEMSDKLDENPRATHYGPPAMYELNRAGVGDDVRAKGFIPRVVCWRKIDGTMLAGIDGSVMDGDPDRMVCLPLNKLGTILYEHVSRQPTAKILFKHKVTATGQDDDKAWVDVQSPDGQSRMDADYIIGCDGANSQIRRSLFGDWNFPGRTWDEQIVATNVRGRCTSPDTSNRPANSATG
jgi:hypothetical protein